MSPNSVVEPQSTPQPAPTAQQSDLRRIIRITAIAGLANTALLFFAFGQSCHLSFSVLSSATNACSGPVQLVSIVAVVTAFMAVPFMEAKYLSKRGVPHALAVTYGAQVVGGVVSFILLKSLLDGSASDSPARGWALVTQLLAVPLLVLICSITRGNYDEPR
jgi:hypothetical protein